MKPSTLRNRNRRHPRGQGMTEYIIIVALIAISAIGVVTQFGDNIKALFGMAIDATSGQQSVEARTKKSNAKMEHATMSTFAKNNKPD